MDLLQFVCECGNSHSLDKIVRFLSEGGDDQKASSGNKDLEYEINIGIQTSKCLKWTKKIQGSSLYWELTDPSMELARKYWSCSMSETKLQAESR